LGIRDRLVQCRSGFEALAGHLAEAAVAVNPRIAADGLPQKVLNYMAAGLPIVSFAGSANMLIHERTALVVPDGDLAGFGAAIQRLLNSPELARRLGDTARKQAVQSLSWNTAAEGLEEVYARVAGRVP
jgi:glycosyltransferase involved in cell wall biosynthesis